MADVENPDIQKRSRIWLKVGPLIEAHGLAVRIAVHIFIFALSLLIAYLIRFDFANISKDWFENFLRWLPVFIILKLIIFGWMNLFWGGWRTSSVRDILKILAASWVFLFIVFPINLLARGCPPLDLARKR